MLTDRPWDDSCPACHDVHPTGECPAAAPDPWDAADEAYETHRDDLAA